MKAKMLHSPTFITGRGSISYVKELNKKRIGIVRGGRSYNDTTRKTIEKIAAETGATIQYLAQITAEPHIQDIFSYLEGVKAFQPDLILAIGGGSVLDTAKALHLFYENPDLTFEQSLIPYTLPPLGKKAIHCSVPTTSGTGSEATSAAVFIDPDTHRKCLLLDNGLIPHCAILDADLVDSLPSSITITTGLDALTHAVEASVAKNASVLTKALALEAALDIMEALPLLQHNISVKESREKLHIASALAGVAITNSCTGIAHSYDHPGPAFHLPHGTVCGLMLPYTMALCAKTLCSPTNSYVTLATRLGYQGDPSEKTKQLIQHIFALLKETEGKTSFQEYGISWEEYSKWIPEWSETSLPAFATMMSPANMTLEMGVELYKNCYYGNIEF